MTLIAALRRYLWQRRLRRAVSQHARTCPTGRAFYAALAQAERDNAAWRREQRRAASRARWGLPIALAALCIACTLASATIALAHYEPDPCHPQTQHTMGHEETCTHDQDDDHSHQGDR